MNSLKKKRFALNRRRLRVRKKVVGTPERPRLLVHTTLAHIYAQVIDDSDGRVVASASTVTPDLRANLRATGNIAAAQEVGKRIAAEAGAKGIRKVCFDRGGRKYHGRVKALADAARESGLVF
jgi:large subunit ribosomal protein L18